MTRFGRRYAGQLCRMVASASLALAVGSAAQDTPSLTRVAELIRSGQVEQAVRMADRLSEAAPADPRPRTLKGVGLAALGRTEEALEVYASALTIEPDYLPALQGAAELEMRLGRAQAAGRLARILRLQPDNHTAHAMLGVIAYRARDCERALEHFVRGETVVVGDAEALRQRAECRFSLGRFDQAAEDFRRLLARPKANPAMRYNLGLALYEAGRADEAVTELAALVDAADPPDIETLSLLADAQHAALDSPGALATLQRAIGSHPRAERLYLQLAELCIEHGAYDLGVEIVDIGEQNIPASHRILTMRGILLAELGRYDEAETAFAGAAEADSETQSAAVGLSLTLQKTGRMDESLEVLRQRVAARPDDAVAQFFYSQALIKQGVEPGSPGFREALEGLLLAAERLPGEASPRIELGKLYLQAKQPERAIAVLAEATQLAPDDRQATYNLMIALRRVGRADEAAALAVRMREQLERAQDQEIQRNRYRLVRIGQQRP